MKKRNEPTVAESSQSAKLYQRACRVMPDGVSRNTVLHSPHPFYAERGEGCYVTDIEGVKRIDFSNNMTSLIHGHAHPDIVACVTEQLSKGTAFAMATEVEVNYAEFICAHNGSFDKIRFVNSGTEAVMASLKAARAFTGRPKIAKVEGAYHGLYDFAEVSQTASPENWGDADSPASVPVAYGTPPATLDDVIVIPFNDVERSIAILNRHVDALSCVLLDLMPHRVGLIPASQEFVDTLRKWTHENDVLLICDEVITYRNDYGGAQNHYNLFPDLTTMGKIIGGGFPIGALAGRKDVMDVMASIAGKILFPQSGTFSANPITLVAGHTAMEMFNRMAINELNQLTEQARSQITEAIKISGISACVTGVGSMLRVHLKAEAPKNYRSAYVNFEEAKLIKKLLDYLFNNGIMMINTCSAAMSTVMTMREIDTLSEVILQGFREIKDDQDRLLKLSDAK